MKFEKWHGLGNDFILIEGEPAQLNQEQVAHLCDRHRGIGADGILFLTREPLGMVVINADGSRSEMCGNGLRCAVGYAITRGWAADAVMDFGTDAGVKSARLLGHGPAGHRIQIDLGIVTLGSRFVVPDGDRTWSFQEVGVGNPHAVTLDPFALGDVERMGRAVERLRSGGQNVEFCDPASDPAVLHVWERGAGATLACGTGACAAAGVLCARGLRAFDEPMRIELPGGVLEICITKEMRAWMTGPAMRVFVGDLGMF